MDKVCPRCNAVYTNLRWSFNDGLLKELKGRKDVERKLCSGCDKIAKRQVDGIVNLKGWFLLQHKKEVLNLIMRVAEARKRTSIAARIINLDDRRDEVTIETTDRHLAERIGKEVEKAFHGKLDIKWLKKEDFVRVNWHRD
jgi:hypothetical protein